VTPLLIVLSAALATWLLRIVFITVLPADRLPARVRRAFDDVAPSVLAAIVVSHVVRGFGPGDIPWPTLAAVVAAAAAAWWSKNLVLPVVAGVAVFGLLPVASNLFGPAPTGAEGTERAHVLPRGADTAPWAQAADARLTRERVAARAGVAEASRFLDAQVVVDDRAWSGAVYEGRAAWQAHLSSVYRLTLDEYHHQRSFIDPRGALVQQHQDYLAGFGRPANVVQLREYGPTGVERLRTAVAIRDLQRHAGAGPPRGYEEFEDLAHRYVSAWSGGQDRVAIASLYAADAELRDEVVGTTLSGRQDIGHAVDPGAASLTGTRALLPVPGSGDPAIYLDAQAPSAISSLVLVHGPTAGAGCPDTVAVQLELVDGLIVGERRFHDLPSARRCLDELPDGWWTSLVPLGPADARTGTLLVDGREVPLLNSVPELDELLTWALERFEAAGLGAPAIRSITFAGASGRCAGIGGSVDVEADGVRVLLCLDASSACIGTDCASFSMYARSTVLHELAHAWELTRLDDRTRRAFLALRELETWSGSRAVPWAERGAEQAAEILMWGLLEAPPPLPRLGGMPCEDALAGYRLLTGRPPLNGGCPDPAAPGAGA
jgi:branched-subunit amino acid transport protein